ncbi:lysozyme inhibitor LprI family protein [Pseudoxanthomonas daejeonensis]|uniref:Lysozyme inhibitor LprI-like N-terminal domain-containing protein n=1 Tax=Pseudoxanthomonas daejeonensis TaxID=266062 RepID=A0ABQ6ZC03_9GAMM|nr:lysozyme inhibitor LprI family protein [Pseudoxanthomonas daejeonensis]KAF1697591.1 hypothetical protein CSC65_01665 [Pseudoxanthomonas daejeonensis]
MERGIARIVAALATWLLLPGVALAGAGPSFDCGKARAPIERTICDTPRVALLDAILARYYARARSSLPRAGRACLAADQRAWLALQRAACDSAACLEQAYLLRLDALEGLLPGAVVDRRLEDYPVTGGARLLGVLPAVEGGQLPPGGLEEVLMQGTPVEDEGGYLLVDGRFDRNSWQEFVDLQGDIEAIHARFGEGPVHFTGVAGGFGAGALDDRARAAIEDVAARRGELQVRGWAVYTDAAPPLIDDRRCAFVYGLPAP